MDYLGDKVLSVFEKRQAKNTKTHTKSKKCVQRVRRNERRAIVDFGARRKKKGREDKKRQGKRTEEKRKEKKRKKETETGKRKSPLHKKTRPEDLKCISEAKGRDKRTEHRIQNTDRQDESGKRSRTIREAIKGKCQW